MSKISNMKQYQKEQVREALKRYCAGFGTQKAAAKSLQGVTTYAVMGILNNKWEDLSGTVWQNVARQVGFYTGNEWQQADTSAYLLLRILFNDAQYNAMAYGVAMTTGIGKTFAAERYAREDDKVYYIKCAEEMNRKTLVNALATSIGLAIGNTVEDTMGAVIDHMKRSEETLIILDDAQLLKDRVLAFAATIYSHLCGRAGIVMLGNDDLRMKIVEGVRLNRDGYEAIYRSIGRRFITLGRLSDKDITLVCRANGIGEGKTIESIIDTCGSNLHLVTKEITSLTPTQH